MFADSRFIAKTMGGVALGSQLFTETCEAYGGTWQLLPSASGAEFTMTADITRITAR